MTYTNGIFHLREYGFIDLYHYNSLILLRERKYTVRDGAINVETIQQILKQVKIVSEPKIAFPQANSFERVINLCELLKQKTELAKDEITANYDFDERQTNYYTDAARYLDLVEKKKENRQIIYFLTKKGNYLFNLPLIDRQIEFTKCVLSHLAFRKTLELYLESSELPDTSSIVIIMKSSGLYKIDSESTFIRRASTISGWVDWIMDLVEE